MYLTGTQQSLALNLRGVTSSKHSPVPCCHWRPEGPEKSELLNVFFFKGGVVREALGISSPSSRFQVPRQGIVEIPVGGSESTYNHGAPALAGPGESEKNQGTLS